MQQSQVPYQHAHKFGGLISLLEDLQAEYGYLPQAKLEEVAEQTGRSLVDIYGVATFFRAFSLKPRGKHLVSVCLGTACHVRGSPAIAEEVSRCLGIPPGETTADDEFTLETVNCLGACALGPVVVIDGHNFPSVRKSQVKEILQRARTGLDRVDLKADPRVFPVAVRCPRCNRSLVDASYPLDDHSSIRLMASFQHQTGWVRLSSLYGSRTVAAEFEIPEGEVVDFFCPHCHAGLGNSAACSDCGAGMATLIVQGGGVVQVCSRRGCAGHILDLSGDAIF